MNEFIEDFSECLEKLASEDTTSYILGDINININESSKEALLFGAEPFFNIFKNRCQSGGTH